MSTTECDMDDVVVIDHELWRDAPPHELFARLRRECPVHWSNRMPDFEGEEGYWSVTRADDVHTVSRDWKTYSSELGGVIATTHVMPLQLVQAMFIGMDPPKHDRLKNLFQAGFTPRRIAAHEPAIREIAGAVLD
ncbi:MAG: cytochrome P450, partial [Solirubrobacteraceae bacterium]